MIGYVMAAHTPDDSFRNGEDALIGSYNWQSKTDISTDEEKLIRDFLVDHHTNEKFSVIKIERLGEIFNIKKLNKITGEIFNQECSIKCTKLIKELCDAKIYYQEPTSDLKNVCKFTHPDFIDTKDFGSPDTTSKIQNLNNASGTDSDETQDKLIFHFHVRTDKSPEHLMIPIYKRNNDGTITKYY